MIPPDNLPRLTVRVLWHIDYWDGMLSGIGRCEGRLVYLAVPKDQDDATERIYLVYPLTEEEAATEVACHEDWRRLVGTHTDYDEEGRRAVGRCHGGHEDWQAWSALWGESTHLAAVKTRPPLGWFWPSSKAVGENARLMEATLLRRNARLRAWKSCGVPLEGGWQLVGDRRDVSPHAQLELRCLECGCRVFHVAYRPEDVEVKDTECVEVCECREHEVCCEHLRPLTTREDPPEVAGIAGLELLAG